MSNQQKAASGYKNLGSRIAEEIQLLTEEKWIIEALTKIKNQRNCLQIERLHLESLKAKLNGKERAQESTNNKESASTSDSLAIDLMKNTILMNSSNGAGGHATRDIEEADCNEEELNLTVTNPVLSKTSNIQNLDIEEEEEDEEMDCEEDMVLDMDMFMKLKS